VNRLDVPRTFTFYVKPKSKTEILSDMRRRGYFWRRMDDDGPILCRERDLICVNVNRSTLRDFILV